MSLLLLFHPGIAAGPTPPPTVVTEAQIQGYGGAASRRRALEDEDAELVAVLAAFFSQKRD